MEGHMTKKPKCQGLSHCLRVEPPYIPLLYAYFAKLSGLNLDNFAKCSFTCDVYLASIEEIVYRHEY